MSRSAKALLFFGFAFAVMADPVSSVAYAIEAALRALDGHLEDLFPAMAIVIAVVVLVTINYWFLVRRFPQGGGDAEAAGRAFGTAWAFPVIGALIVDFVLTISISIAAASSAIIAYVPGLHDFRIPLAIGLTTLVAGLTWFGHAGRVLAPEQRPRRWFHLPSLPLTEAGKVDTAAVVRAVAREGADA